MSDESQFGRWVRELLAKNEQQNEALERFRAFMRAWDAWNKSIESDTDDRPLLAVADVARAAITAQDMGEA